MAVHVGLGFTSAAHADQHQTDDVKAIETLYAQWRRAVEASDIDGYVEILDSEVRLMPPGAPAIEGAARYRTFLGPVFAAATYDIVVDQYQTIEVLGDTATAEYVYTITLSRLDEGVEVAEGALTSDTTTARYFDVLRKSTDGEWRVWRHLWQNFETP